MLSKGRIAGAGALLLAPIVVIAANVARPTLSDDAATQVTAFTDHRGAMIAGIALSAIAIALLTGGIVWLALELAPRAPRLALAGGTLGVFGSLVTVFVTGLSAAAPTVVHGLSPAQATATLHSIQSSAAVTGLEPIQLLGDIGVALLGIAAMRAGAPRWAAAAIAIGALGEGAGFATGTKALVIVAFAILFVGLLEAVRTVVASPGEQTATRTAAGSVAAAGGRLR
jgi:hypothetical protein